MLYRSIRNCRGHFSGALLVLAVCVLLAGCVTRRSNASAPDVRPVPKASFVIVDRRPEDERTSRWLSDVVRSCAFTVRQYGDEATWPDRFSVLAESLDMALHERLAGKTLLVTHFGIYINGAQRPSVHGDGLLQSLADYAAESRFGRLCAPEEVTQGWLEAGHKDAGGPVVIVQITFILDGRMHNVRVFENTSAPATGAAMVGAVKKAAERIVADLLARPNVLTAEAQ